MDGTMAAALPRSWEASASFLPPSPASRCPRALTPCQPATRLLRRIRPNTRHSTFPLSAINIPALSALPHGGSSNSCMPLYCVPRLRCRSRGSGEHADKDEKPGSAESLFARELRKRGLARPASAPASERARDGARESSAAGGTAEREGGGGSSQSSSYTSASASGARDAKPSPGSWAEGQRERSLGLNSEGLEGLPTRAKALIQLGLSFYLSLWPLALVLVAVFLALYLAAGSSFIHGGKPPASSTAPTYIDPYQLLREDEERLPLIPFRTSPSPPSLSP